ncbi:hypothetical protein M9458_002681, partial [Cirrhinus mrigala]
SAQLGLQCGETPDKSIRKSSHYPLQELPCLPTADPTGEGLFRCSGLPHSTFTS